MAADSRGGTAIAYETILFQQDIQPVQVPIIFVFVKEEPVETFMGAIAADNDIAFDENIVLLVAVNDQNARACSRNHVVLDDRSAGISFEQSHARCPAPFGVGIIIIGFERQVAIHLVVTDDGVASSRDDSWAEPETLLPSSRELQQACCTMTRPTRRSKHGNFAHNILHKGYGRPARQ